MKADLPSRRASESNNSGLVWISAAAVAALGFTFWVQSESMAQRQWPIPQPIEFSDASTTQQLNAPVAPAKMPVRLFNADRPADPFDRRGDQAQWDLANTMKQSAAAAKASINVLQSPRGPASGNTTAFPWPSPVDSAANAGDQVAQRFQNGAQQAMDAMVGGVVEKVADATTDATDRASGLVEPSSANANESVHDISNRVTEKLSQNINTPVTQIIRPERVDGRIRLPQVNVPAVQTVVPQHLPNTADQIANVRNALPQAVDAAQGQAHDGVGGDTNGLVQNAPNGVSPTIRVPDLTGGALRLPQITIPKPKKHELRVRDFAGVTAPDADAREATPRGNALSVSSNPIGPNPIGPNPTGDASNGDASYGVASNGVVPNGATSQSQFVLPETPLPEFPQPEFGTNAAQTQPAPLGEPSVDFPPPAEVVSNQNGPTMNRPDVASTAPVGLSSQPLASPAVEAPTINIPVPPQFAANSVAPPGASPPITATPTLPPSGADAPTQFQLPEGPLAPPIQAPPIQAPQVATRTLTFPNTPATSPSVAGNAPRMAVPQLPGVPQFDAPALLQSPPQQSPTATAQAAPPTIQSAGQAPPQNFVATSPLAPQLTPNQPTNTQPPPAQPIGLPSSVQQDRVAASGPVSQQQVTRTSPPPGAPLPRPNTTTVTKPSNVSTASIPAAAPLASQRDSAWNGGNVVLPETNPEVARANVVQPTQGAAPPVANQAANQRPSAAAAIPASPQLNNRDLLPPPGQTTGTGRPPSVGPAAERRLPPPNSVVAKGPISTSHVFKPNTDQPNAHGKLVNETRIVAMVGNQPILEGDILGQVNEMLRQHEGQIPPEELETQRELLMKQALPSMIDNKLVYLDFMSEIAPEKFPELEKRVFDVFAETELPKLIEKANVNSPRELDAKLRQIGSSIEKQRRLFMERAVAQQKVQAEVNFNREVKHDEMLQYYEDHIKEYSIESRAKFEHLMVRFDRFDSFDANGNYDENKAKREARVAIAKMGNEVMAGAPLPAVAKRSSHGPLAHEGGTHDWTTHGSLASEKIDKALFSLPIGRLSQIIEDEQGLHILRVTEREPAGTVPFAEVQDQIAQTIKKQRFQQGVNRYLAGLRASTYVGTIYDGTLMATPEGQLLR